MKTRTIIILILSVIILQSCLCKKDAPQLNSDEQGWQPYSVGNVLTFVSDSTGDSLVYKITGITTDEQEITGCFVPKGHTYYYVSFSLIKKPDYLDIDNSTYYNVYLDYNPAADLRSIDFKFLGSTCNCSTNDAQEMEIDGIAYKEVVKSYREYKIAKGYGIIQIMRFSESKNEKFNLTSN